MEMTQSPGTYSLFQEHQVTFLKTQTSHISYLNCSLFLRMVLIWVFLNLVFYRNPKYKSSNTYFRSRLKVHALNKICSREFLFTTITFSSAKQNGHIWLNSARDLARGSSLVLPFSLPFSKLCLEQGCIKPEVREPISS